MGQRGEWPLGWFYHPAPSSGTLDVTSWVHRTKIKCCTLLTVLSFFFFFPLRYHCCHLLNNCHDYQFIQFGCKLYGTASLEGSRRTFLFVLLVGRAHSGTSGLALVVSCVACSIMNSVVMFAKCLLRGEML